MLWILPRNNYIYYINQKIKKHGRIYFAHLLYGADKHPCNNKIYRNDRNQTLVRHVCTIANKKNHKKMERNLNRIAYDRPPHTQLDVYMYNNCIYNNRMYYRKNQKRLGFIRQQPTKQSINQPDGFRSGFFCVKK